MEQSEPTSQVIELQARINYLNNELAIRNEEVGFLKASLQQTEAEKEALTRNLEESRHEGEYLTSRYKAESKVLRKDNEQLEKKLEKRTVECRKMKALLEEKNTELVRSHEKYQQLEHHHTSKGEEYKRVGNDQKGRIAELEKLVKRLKLDIKTVEQAKGEACEDTKQSRAEIQLVRTELKDAHKLNQNLTRKLEGETKKLRDLKDQLESKNKDIQELSDRYRLLEMRMGESEERISREQKRLAKESATIQTHSLQSLRQQHDKIVRFYTEQLSSMKDQVERYRNSDSLSSPTAVKNQQQRQRTLIDMLNNCLAYDLPYIGLIDSEKEFKQHPQLHRLFEGIRFKLEHIETLKESIKELQKENAEVEEKLGTAGLDILDLTQRLRMSEKEHQHSYEAVRQQLAEYVKERDIQFSRLSNELQKKEEELQMLRVDKTTLERQATQPAQTRSNRPEDLLEINHINASLRVKMIGLGNVIEVLLALLVQQYRLTDMTEVKLRYYRIYEGFYWNLRRGSIGTTTSSQHSHSLKKRLRKAFIVAYFAKLCECKMKRSLLISPNSTLSQLNRQVGERRLSIGLCKQSQQEERLVQNLILEELKNYEWTHRNEIDWVVQLVKQQQFNSSAIQAKEKERINCYPSILFAREVTNFQQRIEGHFPYEPENDPKRSAVNRSEANYTAFYDQFLRQPLIQSRKVSKPPSQIGELKRQLDQALFSAARSEVSLGALSPRMCGSIRSLRTRPV